MTKMKILRINSRQWAVSDVGSWDFIIAGRLISITDSLRCQTNRTALSVGHGVQHVRPKCHLV